MMAKRDIKSDCRTALNSKSIAEMQKIFEQYPQNDLDRLFDILKTVADETRDLATALPGRIDGSNIPDSYLEGVRSEYKEFIGGHFNFDSDDCFSLKKDADGNLYVYIWYNELYPPSFYKKSEINDYVENVGKAIESFEDVKKQILAIENSLDMSIASYQTDKKTAWAIKSSMSEDELAALIRLGALNM